MNHLPEGRAIVYCEGAFGTPSGKTAHGLVRRTERYQVLSVIDSRAGGGDAGERLDGRPTGVPLLEGLRRAIEDARRAGTPATHLVIGLAPDGGRLPISARAAVREAIEAGLHVDSGLHDFLSDDPELSDLARERGVVLRDVRKPPPREELHFFAGRIEEVESFRVAVLGTDSAVGKRTTAWLLVDGLREAGLSTVLIGTGQTAWLQGARYGVVLDSLVNDFVSGEIEHAVLRAWMAERPDAMVVEGQGSLMNPAYPGGYEILAAARPHVIVLQHAPRRKDYDGFPGYPIHPLERQIRALELVSDRPVVAIALNHEGMSVDEVAAACEEVARETGLPTYDVLGEGPARLARQLARLHAARGESPSAVDGSAGLAAGSAGAVGGSARGKGP